MTTSKDKEGTFGPRFTMLKTAWAVLWVFALTGELRAQETTARDPNATAPPPPPTARAVERSGDIDVDGRLDEDAWAAAPIASGFVQREPVEGAPADQQTEVRILFDGAAIYVGARMYDSEPETIADQLVRRDEWGQHDFIEVAFDPNRDRRTGYRFRVSFGNTQRDVYLYEDGDQDDTWDAVWSSGVHRDSLGWTAELRIPLAQMRYEASDDVQQWGINFTRRRLRTNEWTQFALISRLQDGEVSQFGTLDGIQISRASRLLEFRPYVLSQAFTAPSVTNDPFFDGSDFDSRVGVDIRYGLGPQFTLDATINPDFGQVEADPAVINLTAFETRFEERRPFFVEDAQIFDFSLSAGQDLYYSRRIGRSPHGRPPDDAEFTDIPDAATILAATKLTGRTTGGLSVGGLAALTQRETGRAVLESSSAVQTFPVEPRAAFGVVRLQQDFNDGTSTVGGIVTGMNRALPSDGSFDFLPRSAFSVGLDYEHQWSDRAWAVFGYISASHVRGDSTAMTRIQRSSNHFRQRPDARFTKLDSTATSLTGVDWRFTFARQRGTHWTGSVWLAQTAPGFEINDLGFSRRQEALDGGARLSYQEIQPGTLFRSYQATFSTFHNFSHDALDDAGSWDSWRRAHVSGSFNLSGEVEFLNYWELNGGFSYRPGRMDRTATRGGPLIVSPRGGRVDLQLQTDRRARFNIGPSLEYEWNALDAGSRFEVGLEMEIRPSSRIELELEPQFSLSRWAAQYVSTTDVPPYQPTFGSRYLFGDLEQRELEIETRLNVVFSPTLTLQLFAQPLLASGDYLSYRQLVAPEAFDFDVFEEGTFTPSVAGAACLNGRTCVDNDGTRHIDFDGNGVVDYSFGDRNFNVRSLVGNLVLRWEYRPGSTLFFVWQRQQENETSIGNFDFGRDLGALFDAPAENTFMIKLSYWIGL